MSDDYPDALRLPVHIPVKTRNSRDRELFCVVAEDTMAVIIDRIRNLLAPGRTLVVAEALGDDWPVIRAGYTVSQDTCHNDCEPGCVGFHTTHRNGGWVGEARLDGHRLGNRLFLYAPDGSTEKAVYERAISRYTFPGVGVRGITYVTIDGGRTDTDWGDPDLIRIDHYNEDRVRTRFEVRFVRGTEQGNW